MPSIDDFAVGFRALSEAVADSPLRSPRTLAIVVGDGLQAKVGRLLCRTLPREAAIVSIDPCYTPSFRRRNLCLKLPARLRNNLRGSKAEAVALEPLLRKHPETSAILFVAFWAHTNANKFYARLREAAKAVLPKASLYAVCQRCCRPGLSSTLSRERYETTYHNRALELAYPGPKTALGPVRQRLLLAAKKIEEQRRPVRQRLLLAAKKIEEQRRKRKVTVRRVSPKPLVKKAPAKRVAKKAPAQRAAKKAPAKKTPVKRAAKKAPAKKTPVKRAAKSASA